MEGDHLEGTEQPEDKTLEAGREDFPGAWWEEFERALPYLEKYKAAGELALGSAQATPNDLAPHATPTPTECPNGRDISDQEEMEPIPTGVPTPSPTSPPQWIIDIPVPTWEDTGSASL